tara:strand:+ start:798 stop:4202 length:3405 start_codon:yes stop_codon:yes gene_type:complete
VSEKFLNSKYNLDFEDLYDVDGLHRIENYFYEFFQQQDETLYQQFLILRSDQSKFSKKEASEILIAAAIHVENFIVDLFDIKKYNDNLIDRHSEFNIVAAVKRDFVQRKAVKKIKEFEFDFDRKQALELVFKDINVAQFTKRKVAEVEIAIAKKIRSILDQKSADSEELLRPFYQYSSWAINSREGHDFHENGALFKLPQKIDYQNLVYQNIDGKKKKLRAGFDLLDTGFNLNQSVSEANYCIFCHKQEKDSCRKGLADKKTAEIVDNELGVKLEGCPLDQKISEMNIVKSQGRSLASMVIAAIDNPLMAATGHRICNDCMKACIFQKQDPVNIPQIESENLKDILQLPYGFEIYSLISRWNPLNLEQENILQDNGKSVLVAGLGPAGFTLAYYLLNKGYRVVAIDGLKIEPLAPEISGIDIDGNRVKFKPIKNIDEIYDDLSKRLIQGFGGVAEYGITCRWDKNFLTVIRLLLERRVNFRMFGGVRFGSSITDDIAFDDYNFDHVALCIGAGRPKIVDLEDNFCKGIKSASDFLMNLQLGGAYKDELFSNLQIRAPIMVVGAGLTATDTACEAQEYYAKQIEKFAKKVKILEGFYGVEKFWKFFTDYEKKIADEFLSHNKILQQGGKAELYKEIGNVKILYRKKIQQSPAYRQNHEELIQAIAQGVEFVEEAEIKKVIKDEEGFLQKVIFKDGQELKCKTLLIAAGTDPNISVVDEDKLGLDLDGKYFAQIDLQGNKKPKNHFVKHGDYSFFNRIDDDGKSISFFGDLHPNFEGSVVKAIASAKIGHSQIDNFLKSKKVGLMEDLANRLHLRNNFFTKINRDFAAKIVAVRPISNSLNEVTIKAPLIAKRSQIGHIFRLQNFHALSNLHKGQLMAMEGIALTGTIINRKQGTISGTLLDYGGSTSLVKYFEEGQSCILMGPSGKKTVIRDDENVLLVGSGRGNAVLTRMAQKFRQKNNHVTLMLCFKDESLICNVDEMIQNSDRLVMSVLGGVEDQSFLRKGDKIFSSNLDIALKIYCQDKKFDRILVIGNDKMMSQIAQITKEGRVKAFSDCDNVVVSLNSPMQCMMKGVCSQCIQKRQLSDGSFEYYYSCADQDQDARVVDFSHLTSRCDQNKLSEKLIKFWIGYLEDPYS